MEPGEALRRVLFLKTAPEEAITDLIAAGAEQVLDKGEVLFSELGRSVGLLVVLRGAVKVYKLDSRGRELTLSLERAGASVGELPLFDGGNYPYSAEAAEADTSVWRVPRDRFRDVMRAHPEIAERGLLALGIRLRQMVVIAEAQSLYSVRARLAAYLRDVSRGRETFRLEETNEAIAGRLGTVREVVSRTLRHLKDAGVIGLNGRLVTVADGEELTRIADGTSQ